MARPATRTVLLIAVALAGALLAGCGAATGTPRAGTVFRVRAS